MEMRDGVPKMAYRKESGVNHSGERVSLEEMQDEPSERTIILIRTN